MTIDADADLDAPEEPLPITAFRRSTLGSLDVAVAESHLPPWTQELLACLGARARTAFVLRQAGMAHTQIGLHLGVSSNRARQLCIAAEHRMVEAARRGAALPRGIMRTHTCEASTPCRATGAAHRLLDLPVEALDLSIRSCAGLSHRGVVRIGELVVRSPAEVLRFPFIGIKSLREIEVALARVGLHLGMTVGDWTAAPGRTADQPEPPAVTRLRGTGGQPGSARTGLGSGSAVPPGCAPSLKWSRAFWNTRHVVWSSTRG